MTVCLCEECDHETSDICLDETIALCLCCVEFDLKTGDRLHHDYLVTFAETKIIDAKPEEKA